MSEFAASLAIALFCGGDAPLAVFQAVAPEELVVTTTSDVVNGDTRSPTALAAEPGPDGISLREALTAVATVTGPHVIRLAAELGGHVITLTRPLPTVRQDGVTLEGPANDRGEPTVTLDASGVGGDVLRPALNIAASDFVLRGLRVVGVPPPSAAVRIRAGATEDGAQGPQEVRNVLIEGNIFANDGINTTAYGVTLGTDPSGVDTRVEGVLIRSNVFRHYRGDGTVVHLQNHGSRGLIQDVTIQENVFVESEFPIELVNVQGSANRIVGTRVIGNSFRDNEDGVLLLNGGRPGISAAENQIAGTLISGNTFMGKRLAISLLGGFENADKNTITNTLIVNNVIAGGRGGILIRGGDTGGRANRVSTVRIVNSTVVGLNSALAIHGNVGGAGNTIHDILVTNSIFWMNVGEFIGDISSASVRSSITRQYGGTNRNISADPRFIDLAQLDVHLAATSPAIDLGEVAGSPAADLECHLRIGAPDLGALEFGASEIVDTDRCHAWPTR